MHRIQTHGTLERDPVLASSFTDKCDPLHRLVIGFEVRRRSMSKHIDTHDEVSFTGLYNRVWLRVVHPP